MDGVPHTVTTSLPLPVCHVGYVFLAHGESADGPAYFCECSRLAITHFILNAAEEQRGLLRAGKPAFHDGVNWRNAHTFPRAIREELWDASFADGKLFDRLRFRSGICHRCQRAVPPHRMYCDHSFFENVFARLIYHDHYTWGFDTVSMPLPHVRTPAQASILPPGFAELACEQRRLSELYYSNPPMSPVRNTRSDVIPWGRLHVEYGRVTREFQAAKAKIRAHIAAELRKHLEFPPHKKHLQRETVLFLSVRSIYRGQEIVRHARPDFLRGLELDIWLPALRLAIEFQGAQHGKAVAHWGGEKGLAELQKRDRRKRRLCAAQGVRLVYFTQDEDLNESAVCLRLSTAG